MFDLNTNIEKTYEISVKGLVQGVGFRPFIYLLAEEFNLCGWVENSNSGVIIHANMNEVTVKDFCTAIREKAPRASTVFEIKHTHIDKEEFSEFYIKKSENISDEITEVSPDIAVCEDCLEDIKESKNRKDYAFTNCTNCGTRFSITKELPYDREKTTMHPFEMCTDCHDEYVNIRDRRFHAQPTACNHCGPHYYISENEQINTDINSILTKAAKIIENAGTVLFKGLGGYVLICNAYDEKAVANLRMVKQRKAKPLAIMIKDDRILPELKDKEKEVLNSWRRPILLTDAGLDIAENITYGLKKTGLMLPYQPIHFMLFDHLKTDALVYTSANLSGCPIITNNDEAEKIFNDKVDMIIHYNREIHNHCDDSLVQIINDKLQILRHGRGYAPTHIKTDLKTEGILALGAELTNTIALGKSNQAIISQYIGDLKNFETYQLFDSAYKKLSHLYRFNSEIIVRDTHPGYISNQYFKVDDCQEFNVQHHHAHIASVMAEHNLDEEVIGVAFDGTGYGDDGSIWGSEILIADLEKFERYTHLDYFKLPGGDLCSKEVWRTAVSLLYKTFENDLFKLNLPLIEKFSDDIPNIIFMLEKNVNTAKTSSAGRFFDAMASILDICHYNNYQAESPMRLEDIAEIQIDEFYSFDISKTIDFSKMIREIISDINNLLAKSIISAKIHNTFAKMILSSAIKIRNEKKINKIALSGGVFQNRYLLEKSIDLLNFNHFEVFTNQQLPTNDTNIALGQMAIAAKTIQHK